jgi:protein O-GlcNAc transferase
MRILRRVEGSVLWLLQAATSFADNIARQARIYGVAPERILFAPNRPLDQHLARLSLADLFLDSLPYNAHTTASDALWVGLPVLTQCGTSFPGRVATSLLYAAGLPELVTHSNQEYEDLAVQLAVNPAALNMIRGKLTRCCSLFDTDLSRRNLESAYMRMWKHWLAGAKPCAFTV